MAQQIEVTAEQFKRIESAWEICANPGGRSASGKWCKTFDECVALVLGYAPPDTFALRVTA